MCGRYLVGGGRCLSLHNFHMASIVFVLLLSLMWWDPVFQPNSLSLRISGVPAMILHHETRCPVFQQYHTQWDLNEPWDPMFQPYTGIQATHIHIHIHYALWTVRPRVLFLAIHNESCDTLCLSVITLWCILVWGLMMGRCWAVILCNKKTQSYTMHRTL